MLPFSFLSPPFMKLMNAKISFEFSSLISDI